MLVYLFIGLFTGFMSGMFGIGGGSVRIPLLYVAGLPLLSAFGINLLVIPFSSLIAAISHRKNIDWEIARYVIIGGMSGTVTGAFLTGIIPTLVLAIIFLIVSIITVLGIYFDRIFPGIAQKINPDAKTYILGALFLNFLTIMRGGSGGSLFPPFLRMMKLDIRRAIATSLFATIFTAIAGAVIFWYRGDIILLPALAVIIGSVTGARTGSLISLRTKHRWLEIGLSILVIILALVVLIKAI
ncbi:MAG: permease [Candidatus Syntrophoarchaeum caldarius]|uniref:Probable membrane transporter protein n=1 Tax=Candidatus Syntropharchaeum caldarium TaxID=1838285 RepID=A0A1F2PA42_9EURY|nr:MAG: permease [Candidatus Syntrophoarchaeum caldarius]